MAAYTWKTGSYISSKKFDAQAAGEQFEELERTVGLTAENIVEANRPDGAVLHDAFEWDDEAAAVEWRKHQARHLANSICIVVTNEETGDEMQNVRAFFTISKADDEYTHIGRVFASPDKTHALLDTALRELASFKKKYQLLTALQPVFAAIDEVST